MLRASEFDLQCVGAMSAETVKATGGSRSFLIDVLGRCVGMGNGMRNCISVISMVSKFSKKL
jgi:hypothetical protein